MICSGRRAEDDRILIRIPFLDGLRAVAMLMVVGTHALGYAQLESSTRTFISFLVQTVAVPSFFLVDGFLFHHKQRTKPDFSYVGYLASSARRLLLPWAIFTGIYALVRAEFEYNGYLQERLIIGRGVDDIILSMYASSFAAQMYFLLSLFLIRTFSFATRLLVLAPPPAVCMVFCGYAFLWRASQGFWGLGLDPFVHALWGGQFYLLGILLSMFSRRVVRHASVLAVISIFIFGIIKLLPWSLPSVGQYSYLVGFFFLFMAITKTENILTRIGQATMGIYLFHAPVLLKGTSIVIALAINNTCLSYYVLVSFCTFGASLLATKVVARNSYGQYILGKW